MNILLIGAGVPSKDMKGIGGAGAVTIATAEVLAKNHKIYIIPNWSDRLTIRGKNLTVNGVEYLRRILSLRLMYFIIKTSLSCSFKTTLKYTTRWNKLKYSLLYTFDRSHLELVLENLEIDVIHIHGLVPLHLPYIDVAIKKEIPLVCTSHGSYSFNLNTNLDFDRSFEADILMELSNSNNVVITTVSTGVMNKYINNFHIPEDKIKVVLNGIDQKNYLHYEASICDLRKQYSLPKDKYIFLQVGILDKNKNHIAVLEAIKSMEKAFKEKVHYLIVGEGQEKENLSYFIKNNNLNSYVTFTGWLSGKPLVDMYKLSDFFIFSSISEGLPLVFLEAMSSGLPIITFIDLEGVDDIFDSECMELVTNRTAQAINTSMKLAAGRKWNRELIKERSKLWSLEIACAKYTEIYETIVMMRGDLG